MTKFNDFLNNNQAWADAIKAEDPQFFEQLAQGQQPEVLWIGCADSRVPVESLVQANPGDIFVHRNIANQVIATDFNCLSVLQYAVNVLKVKHIIVCGHTLCGGVAAALNQQSPDLVFTNQWLLNIKNVYRLHQAEVDDCVDEKERINKLVELNVKEQVSALAHTSIIQAAWEQQEGPILHGWVYNLSNGLLTTLVTQEPSDEMEPVFQYLPFIE